MFSTHLKIALRNIWRHKVYSFINLFGLSVGLTCCLLIALFVFQELSYDKHHTKADRIYRLTRDFTNPDGTTGLHLAQVAPPFGPLLQSYFPDLEEVVRMLQFSTLVSASPERTFNEENIFFAEPGIFRVFTIPALQGHPAKALNEPFTVMLSEKMAKKYFGSGDPMGKVVRLDNQISAKVTGVFQSFPANSHLHPDFLVSFATLEDDAIYGRQGLQTNWGNNSFNTYLLFPERYPVQKVADQFPAFLDRHVKVDSKAGKKPSSWTHLYLQKLTDIHLRSHLDSELEENGNINSVYLFTAIATFILLIACINFMNLATACSSLRAKEIGVRKVLGAHKKSLVFQFLSESLLFSFLAILLALVLAQLALPIMNDFTGKALAFPVQHLWLWGLGLAGLALLVGLAAGSYPALFLSSFQPVRVLKGKLSAGGDTISLRKVLVVLQFSISVVLLVCTGIVYKQLGFLQNKTLGFDKEHIIVLPYPTELAERYEAFHTQLKGSSHIVEAGRSVGVPSDRLLNSYGNLKISKGDSLVPSPMSFQVLSIDQHFLETYRIKLVAGRNFSKAYPTDDSMAFMLNESGVKMLGFANPQEAVGQSMEYGPRKGKLVGVLQDFHFESMHEKIKPLVFQMGDGYSRISVKLRGGDIPQALADTKKTWQAFLPNRPFDYTFLDESFGRLYEAEQRQARLLTAFAGIAILIACLGVFGLSAFATEQRTKEIGIRKVLGATVWGIVSLLSKDFLKLVVVANLLAWPLAWYGMNRWLQDFAYRTDLAWWVFGLAGSLALLIALFTVGIHAIKAASANPVQALRSE